MDWTAADPARVLERTVVAPSQGRVEYRDDAHAPGYRVWLNWEMHEGTLMGQLFDKGTRIATGPFACDSQRMAPPLTPMDALLFFGLGQTPLMDDNEALIVTGPAPGAVARTLPKNAPPHATRLAWRPSRALVYAPELHDTTTSQGGRTWQCMGHADALDRVDLNLQTMNENAIVALFALDMRLSWIVRTSDPIGVRFQDNLYQTHRLELIAVQLRHPNVWARFTTPVVFFWIDPGQNDTLFDQEVNADAMQTPSWLIMRRCRRLSALASFTYIDVKPDRGMSRVAEKMGALRALRHLNLIPSDASATTTATDIDTWLGLELMQSDVLVMKQRVEELVRDLAQREQALATELERKRTLEQRLADMQTELDRLTQRAVDMSALRQELVRAEAAAEAARVQVATLTQDAARLTRERDAAQATLTALQQAQQVDALNANRIQRLTDDVAQLTLDRDAARAALAALQQSTTTALNTVQTERDAFEKSVKQLTDDVARLTLERDAAQASLKQETDALRATAAERDTLTAKAAQLAVDIAVARQAHTTAVNERDALMRRLDAEKLAYEADKKRLEDARVLAEQERDRALVELTLLERLRDTLVLRRNRIVTLEDAFPFVFERITAPIAKGAVEDDAYGRVEETAFKSVARPLDWYESLHDAEARAMTLGRAAPLRYQPRVATFADWNMILRIVGGVRSDVGELDAIVNASGSGDAVTLIKAWHASLDARQTHSVWARGLGVYGRTWTVRSGGALWDGWCIWRHGRADDPSCDAYTLGPDSMGLVWGPPGGHGRTPLPRVGYLEVRAEGPWQFDATCTFQISMDVAVETLVWNLDARRRIVMSVTQRCLDQVWVLTRRL